MLRNRKNLKDKAVDLQSLKCTSSMILESLTPIYAMLEYLCRRLKKDGIIFQSWFFNGRLWYIEEEGHRKINVSHIRDLYNAFGIDAVDAYLVSS